VKRYQVAALTNVGGRAHNEDSIDWRILPDGSGCWVVADGLGGQGAGEVASAIAAQAVIDDYARDPAVTSDRARQHLSYANQAVLQAQVRTPGGRRMGSTGLLLLLGPQDAVCAHVGDSRLYRFRNAEWTLLTTDHSMAQVLVHTGEISQDEVRASPHRNNLLHSLGSDECRIDVSDLDPPRPGDVFLLCSDGLWEYVTEDSMTALLGASASLDEWLYLMEARLLERVSELGKQDLHDNYTALAVGVRETLGSVCGKADSGPTCPQQRPSSAARRQAPFGDGGTSLSSHRALWILVGIVLLCGIGLAIWYGTVHSPPYPPDQLSPGQKTPDEQGF
jgi:serine/threonine protein phosphatase PrpC